MKRFVMPASSREEIRRGIMFVVLSILMFGLANALVKFAADTYPITEIIFFRCTFGLLPAFALVANSGGFASLHTHRFSEHLSRALLQFLSMMAIFTAFKLMPLTDATAITFASPLFMTVLSIPLLGERVRLHRWGAVLVGFCGILLMVDPGPGIFESGAIFALANAFLGAIVTIALRRMSVTESSSTLVFYQIAITAGFSVLLLPLGWVTPSWRDLLILATIGIASGIGQFWWTQAYRFAPASVAAPFSYTSMIWAVLFDFLVWNSVPTLSLLAGAALVVLSGLYILYRETVRRVAQAEQQPAAPRQE
ncbi:MAG TPA: DMT family transporter [Alphaproteobacteria bacterium]|nr:DMT family transporter [Alphaproteobacteria bacterium]